MQHSRLVEEAEGGEVVAPLQDGRVPQEREVSGGPGQDAGLLGTEGRSEGVTEITPFGFFLTLSTHYV